MNLLRGGIIMTTENKRSLRINSILRKVLLLVVVSMLLFNYLSKDRVKFYIHNSSYIETINGFHRTTIMDVNWFNNKGFVFTTKKNIAYFDFKEKKHILCILDPKTDNITEYEIRLNNIVQNSDTISALDPISLFVDEYHNELAFINNNLEKSQDNYSVLVIDYETGELLFEKSILSYSNNATCALDISNSVIYYTKEAGQRSVSLYCANYPNGNDEKLLVEDLENPVFSYDCKKVAYLKNNTIHVLDLENYEEYLLYPQDIEESLVTRLSFSSDGKFLIYNYEIPRLSFITPSNKNMVYRWDYKANTVKRIYKTMNGSSNTFLYYVLE